MKYSHNIIYCHKLWLFCCPVYLLKRCLLRDIFQSVKYRINTSALNVSPTSFYMCLHSVTIIGPAERDGGLLQIILRNSVCLSLKIEEIRGETAKNRRSNEEPTDWDYRRTQSDIMTENFQPDSETMEQIQ